MAPWRCEACGSPLELDLPAADRATLTDPAVAGVWRYRGWLPDAGIVSLGEPMTGLVGVRERPGTFAKLEGSWFNGREPDEDRWDYDLRAPDSYAGRLSVNPDPHWSAQVSYAWLDSPEALHPDESLQRWTASAFCRACS